MSDIVTYHGAQLDPSTLAQLEYARVAILEHGAQLVIVRRGVNAMGDRHRLTVHLLDYSARKRVELTNLSHAIVASGWMSAGRSKDRQEVVFGGGGMSPVDGTMHQIVRLLGLPTGYAIPVVEL